MFNFKEHARSKLVKGLLGKKQLYSQPFDPFQVLKELSVL